MLAQALRSPTPTEARVLRALVRALPARLDASVRGADGRTLGPRSIHVAPSRIPRGKPLYSGAGQRRVGRVETHAVGGEIPGLYPVKAVIKP